MHSQQRWDSGNIFMTVLSFGPKTTMQINTLLGYVEELDICTDQYLN